MTADVKYKSKLYLVSKSGANSLLSNEKEKVQENYETEPKRLAESTWVLFDNFKKTTQTPYLSSGMNCLKTLHGANINGNVRYT